jgi:hypothetical protein
VARVTGSTALAMATACLKSDFIQPFRGNSGRHRETRPPVSKGIQTAGRPWWDLGRQGRSPAAPTARPRRPHRSRTWRGAPRTTEPRSMSGRRSIRAIARARWQAGMPHDGAPWMVLRLIQLADDLPPHRLRDNSVHRVNDLVSNAQLPINRPSQRSRRVSRHRGSHAAFRSQIRSQHPPRRLPDPNQPFWSARVTW